MTSITYNGTSLSSGTNIGVSDIQHENPTQKRLNIQRFALREGGRFVQADFDVKIITLSGYLKDTTAALLEQRIDNFKKLMNSNEKNLDIAYQGSTRRFICTPTRVTFSRKPYTINYIEWQVEFTVSNPPMGTNLDTTTIEDLSNTNTFAHTLTGQHDGYCDFSGTFRPRPIIQITFNTCNGIRFIRFTNTREDGFITRTTIRDQKFYNGDVVEIDIEAGEVRLNGDVIEYSEGLPSFSLSNNHYVLKVVGISYNVDVKTVYYPLWV